MLNLKRLNHKHYLTTVKTMAEIPYTVRLIRKEELSQALNCWKETGMEQGAQSLYTWMEVDPEAFQVAVTDSGEVIGVCAAVLHHEDLAFVGLYVVKEKYRGSGIGYKVWSACMEHIGHRNATLTAVPGKLEMYRDKGGFPIVETEWTLVVNGAHEAINPEALSDVVPKGVDIEPFQESHLPSMFEYDLSLIGYKRNLAIELICKEKNNQTLVAVKDGVCVGFGTVTLGCQETKLVGPLYADDAQVAEVILRRLIMNFSYGRGVVMITNSANALANEFIKKINCPAISECPRLYRKEKLHVDLNKVFAHMDDNFSPF